MKINKPDLSMLGQIRECAEVLCAYIVTLAPSNRFSEKDGYWGPENQFVKVELISGTKEHEQRGLRFHLLGRPRQYIEHESLPIFSTTNDRCACDFTSICQLGAIASYLDRSAHLYRNPSLISGCLEPMVLEIPPAGDRQFLERDNAECRLQVEEMEQTWLPPYPESPFKDTEPRMCGTPYLSAVSEWHMRAERFARRNGLIPLARLPEK